MTRSQDGVVLVNGPELMELQAALSVIGRASGKTVDVREIDEAAFMEQINFVPKFIATSLAATNKAHDTNGRGMYPKHAETLANVEKIAERAATKLATWAEGAKFAFAG